MLTPTTVDIDLTWLQTIERTRVLVYAICRHPETHEVKGFGTVRIVEVADMLDHDWTVERILTAYCREITFGLDFLARKSAETSPLGLTEWRFIGSVQPRSDDPEAAALHAREQLKIPPRELREYELMR